MKINAYSCFTDVTESTVCRTFVFCNTAVKVALTLHTHRKGHKMKHITSVFIFFRSPLSPLVFCGREDDGEVNESKKQLLRGPHAS